MADVLKFTGSTLLPLPVEQVCAHAKDCTEVIIIGAKNGAPYYASSFSDTYKVLWQLEKFKAFLLNEIEG